MPHAPVTEARRSRNGFPVWVDASSPQVKPPTGHIPRTHSMTVHSAASPITERTGRSPLHSTGANSPNAATYRARTTVSTPQARTAAGRPTIPWRKTGIQYRTDPK